MSLLVPPCAVITGMQPSRTYYQVLDISPDEQDPNVIEEAALRCSSHVRVYQLARESECALLLNEIGQALITLLDPVRRLEYDQGLGKPRSPAPPERRPLGRQHTRVLVRRSKSAPSTLGKAAPPRVVGDGKGCDVKVVYRKCAQ
jgi:hypothetical protein